MKNLVLISLGLFLSLNVFATENPNYICIEQSSFKYEIYSQSNKVDVFDENLEFLFSHDGITVFEDTQVAGNMPPITKVSLFYGSDQKTLGDFILVSGNPVGIGQMRDKVETMKCAEYMFREYLYLD